MPTNISYIRNNRQLLLFLDKIIIAQRPLILARLKILYAKIFTNYQKQLYFSPVRLQIYTLKLKIYGTGYAIKFDQVTNTISFQFGQSHSFEQKIPRNFDFQASILGKKQRILCLRSSCKQLLLAFCATLKKINCIDKYHGKGLRFSKETIKLRIGKKKFS